MLQCIISALRAEAEPLVDYYKLEQDLSYDYPVYKGENIRIICTGVGRKNVRRVLINFYSKLSKEPNYQFINIGIAGAKKGVCKVGQCFIIDSISDDKSDSIYQLNNVFETQILTQNITTVSEPISNGGNKYRSLVDMEAHEICTIVASHDDLENLFIIKIISDFMDVSRKYFSYETVYNLVDNNISNIDKLLMDIRNKK